MINDKREKPVRIKPVMIKLYINKQAKSRKELSFMEIEKLCKKSSYFFAAFVKRSFRQPV